MSRFRFSLTKLLFLIMTSSMSYCASKVYERLHLWTQNCCDLLFDKRRPPQDLRLGLYAVVEQ